MNRKVFLLKHIIKHKGDCYGMACRYCPLYKNCGINSSWSKGFKPNYNKYMLRKIEYCEALLAWQNTDFTKGGISE